MERLPLEKFGKKLERNKIHLVEVIQLLIMESLYKIKLFRIKYFCIKHYVTLVALLDVPNLEAILICVATSSPRPLLQQGVSNVEPLQINSRYIQVYVPTFYCMLKKITNCFGPCCFHQTTQIYY